METLQHDPLTKVQVKEALYAYLYTPVIKQFQTRLNTLIVKNTLLIGSPHKSFHYKGNFYSCDDKPAPRRWNKLVPQLHALMDGYLKDHQDLNRREMPYVMGYINQVLNSSNNFGDYMKLFPECLHPPLHRLIASCPCHTTTLLDEKAAALNLQNAVPISLVKQRMVTNLLI